VKAFLLCFICLDSIPAFAADVKIFFVAFAFFPPSLAKNPENPKKRGIMPRFFGLKGLYEAKWKK
jgi:hypothetical protein